MCTAFVYRGNTVVTAMNYDNDGSDFRLVVHDHTQFVVEAQANRAFFPSFGINRSGTFINDLMVEGNEAGKYRRQNATRWVTTTLIQRVLQDEVPFDDLRQVLAEKTIVCAPNCSTHCMIANRAGDVCIVEPGRGNVWQGRDASRYRVMTNCALLADDGTPLPEVRGGGAERHRRAEDLLSAAADGFGVDDAGGVLQAVQQREGRYVTAFSMVAVPAEQVVVFALFGRLDRRLRFSFAEGTVMADEGCVADERLLRRGVPAAELATW